jgi:hypothetical protein
MKKNLLVSSFFLFVCLIQTSFSQSCANYSVARTTGITFNTISTSGNRIYSWRRTSGSLSNQQDDNRSYQIPIEFDFWYLGTRYNRLSVSVNGFCDFSFSTADGDAGAGGCGANQYRENPNAFTCNLNGTWLALAPLYDDIWANSGGTDPLSASIRYLTTGSYPNRIMTIEWINMDAWNAANGPTYTAGASLNFQVKLYEGSGNIQYVYGNMNGGTASWAYVCGINGSTQSANATTSELLNQTGNNTSTFNNIETTTLSIVPASNTSILFNPTTPTNSSGSLTFSSVTSSSMVLNWPDWASGELGYVIYVSDDGGANYDFLTQIAPNSTTYLANSLSSGTTYKWKLHAVSEGQLSTQLAGTRATLPKSAIRSVANGLWSNPATWSCTCIPNANDDVIISDGTTVTVDMNASCDDLTIGEGTSGILELGNSTANRIITVRGATKIENNGILQSNNIDIATHQLWIKGNIINNGSINLAPGAGSKTRSYFYRGGNQTISGTGSTTNFDAMVLKLDTINALPRTLEVTATNFSASTGFLEMNFGSFKFSSPGTNTITPFAISTSYNSYCGLWMNSANSVMNTLGSLTFYGPFKVTNGIVNIGDAADENLTSGGNALTITSGTVNVAGRLDRSNGVCLIDFKMSGGQLTVNKIGSTSGTLAPFTIDVIGSTFNWTGGNIVIQNAGAGGLGYLNIGASAAYTVNTTGILQIGNASTNASQNIRINSTIPLPNLTVNNTISTIATIITNSLSVNNNVLLSAGSGLVASSLNISAKGDWTNNGATYTPGNNITIFNGTGTQNINGTAVTQTFNDVTVLKTAGQTLQSGGSTINWSIRNLLITTGIVSAPSATLFVTGNWTNNSTFTPNSGAVSFTGAGAQSISSASNASENYYWMYINKTGSILNTSGSITTINVGKSLRIINNTFTAPATINVTDSCWQQGGTFNYPTTFNITGNWYMSNGTSTQNAANVTIGANWKMNNGTLNQNTSTTNIAGNWTQNGGTKNFNTSTVLFNGTGAQQINGTIATHSFYNLTVNKTAGTLLNTGGSLTAITLNNDYLQTQGDFSAPATINAVGHWTHNAGTFSPNVGTVNFNGTTSKSITSNALTSENFYNFILNKTTAGTNVLDVVGTFTNLNVDNNLTITLGNLSAPATINIAKDYSRVNSANAIFTHNNGKVIFDGTTAQALGSAAAQTFYNVEISKAGGIVTSSANPLTTNNFSQLTGSFTTANASVFNIAGNYRQEAGTFINGTTTTINLKGDFIYNGGIFTHNTGNLLLNGTAASQTIRGGLSAVLNNLTLSNTFATVPQMMLDTFLTVRNQLTLTSGILQTDATNILILDKNAASAITTCGIGSTSSFVDGPLRYIMAWNGMSTTLNFPIGKSGVYGAASLAVMHAGAMSYAYTGEMINADADALGYTKPANIQHVSHVRYLDLKRGLTVSPNTSDSKNINVTGINKPRITMYYVANDFVTDAPNLTICKTRANKLEWYDLTASSTGSPSGNSVSPAGSVLFTSFSKFVLANKVGGNNPLPVELITFTASSKGSNNDVIWTSAMEQNFKNYELESSEDGTSFTKINTVEPTGNVSNYNTYNYLDFNYYKPITYYRLKMIDLDFTFKYSSIIAVEYGKNKTDKFVVFPNPATSELYVTLLASDEKEALIDIKDLLGRTIHQQKINLTQGFENTYINTTDFAAGTYMVNVTCGNSFIQTIKVIILNKN